MNEPLTTAEWAVMNALWELSPLTHSGLINALGDRVDWKYTTYGTYLQVLCRKGFVRKEKIGRDNLYYPDRTREECLKLESGSIIKKVRPSGVKDLMLNMVEDAALDETDRLELMELLNRLSKEEGENNAG